MAESPKFKPIVEVKPYEPPPAPHCQFFFTRCSETPTVTLTRQLELGDGSIINHNRPIDLCAEHAEEVRSTWEKV